MCRYKLKSLMVAVVGSVGVFLAGNVVAQDQLPKDNGYSDYHKAPRYRESESHPLRILAYIVHPIGWAARELIFRPLSYFASSTPDTRAVMGFREPFDFRTPSCFSSDDNVPDCRTIMPFDYNKPQGEELTSGKVVYFPDVNFDFNKHVLNKLGRAKAHEVAGLLNKEGAVNIVLEGNADSRGGEAYNQKLGMDRADAVKAELVAQGISGETLTTVSFGESRPLFTEQEEWAYASNRRVAVRFEGNGAR